MAVRQQNDSGFRWTCGGQTIQVKKELSGLSGVLGSDSRVPEISMAVYSCYPVCSGRAESPDVARTTGWKTENQTRLEKRSSC